MKRSTLLNLALVIMATFMFASANAQILTDYSEDEATEMYQTEDRTFRLYVLPDPIYSPSYVAATNSNLGANSEWRFVFTGLTAVAPVVSGTPVAQNWVEFTNPAVGDYTVDVTELNTLIGCEDATPRTTTIHVVAAPSATCTTVDKTDFCGDQAAQEITLSITENVPDNLAAYAFSVEELVEEIDGSGTVIATVSTNSTFVDFTLAAKVKSGTPGFTAATPSFTYTFNSSALNISNNYRTRYTYTFKKASDAGAVADGIISAISHKSDYIDGLTSYAFTDDQVVFIVNPAPVTGPVYHIPNAFNY
ncbi:MAG TPA: hypothetical protein ENN49_00280 [Bacteroidales bacterium]|nr:hypothetical protein [Bacteroidales bacterium]